MLDFELNCIWVKFYWLRHNSGVLCLWIKLNELKKNIYTYLYSMHNPIVYMIIGEKIQKFIQYEIFKKNVYSTFISFIKIINEIVLS